MYVLKKNFFLAGVTASSRDQRESVSIKIVDNDAEDVEDVENASNSVVSGRDGSVFIPTPGR